jgi:hypothetical protein
MGIKAVLIVTQLVSVSSVYRWQNVADNLYKYSLEYDAEGVGDVLFEDYKLRIDSDPRAVTFLIL